MRKPHVHFCRDKTPLEAIAYSPASSQRRTCTRSASRACSSTTISSILISPGYFSRRLTQAPRDANFALDYVEARDHAGRTRGGLQR